ncbi:MAG: putative ABC transporter permease [Firmicutes bacterium]|nr:putative ABC transporter permease [Bacillota bacterium]
MDIFFFLNCFFIYSFLGWVFECIVMSIEEKKPVNRGFIRGPFCTIYGVGALSVYILFKPFADNKILLFVVGAVVATIFEYFVALLMIKIFGSFWWNYDNKKFNYKGIVCLESSLCWGLMSMLTFILFQPMIEKFVNLYFEYFGRQFALLVLFVYILDFSTSFYKAFENRAKTGENIVTIEELEKELVSGEEVECPETSVAVKN